MRLFATLAWRNLWRSRRRSLIAMSSVVFAVVVALTTRSMQLGMYDRTIHNVVSFYTGYLQVHARGFQDSQSLEASFTRPGATASAVEAVRHVTFSAPRLESFALLSSGNVTDGAQLIGIDPAREDHLTGLSRKVASGRYLRAGDAGILLGSELARHLGLQAGDTVIALGSGYHAVSAAGRFRIVGTVRFPAPELNATLAYLALPAAQAFAGAPDRVTSLAVMIDDPRALAGVESALTARLGRSFEVVSWESMMPEMVQYIRLDNASGIVMLLLVYVVIGFGILGTVLMMTMERTREFGVLVAVGMRRRLLGGIVLCESVMLALLGALAGVLLGVPLIAYLARHPVLLSGASARAMERYGFEPILPFLLTPSIFLWQTFAVLVLAVAATGLPLHRVATLDPVTAMREGH